MTRIAAAVVFVCVCVSMVAAQAFMQNDKLVQGGLGIIKMPGVAGSPTVPPVGAGFEYGFHDLVSGGAFFALSGVRDAGGRMVFSLAGEANFHPFNLPVFPEFGVKDKLDPYAGGLIGVNVITGRPARVLWGVIAGCRYYFLDNFSVYAELGRGIGILNLGVTLKL